MSAEVTVSGPVEVYDPSGVVLQAGLSILMASLRELNCALIELKQIQDSHNRKYAVDLAFQNEAGEIIGVRANKAGQTEFVMQNCDSKASQQTIQKIHQVYARIKVLNDVKQKGYQVAKQEVLANGSVRIVVEKWR